tara:strand:+ start:174 stop:1157 length:984 start_codon:yes stop_codon:yes gene_type:complete
MILNKRHRRLRSEAWTRNLVRESNVSSFDFILPIFLTEGNNKKEEISSMPGVFRYSPDNLSEIIDRALKNSIPAVILFPQTPESKKNDSASEALNENNLINISIREIKRKYKNKIGIMTDVALDPYTKHGHDGIFKNNQILNDETVKILVQQSLIQASSGSDVIAPSDMMDGKILEIRKSLEKNNFKNVLILSYAAKYASGFYGPFRDGVGSRQKKKIDKSTYQMDFSNSIDALRQINKDIEDGADMIMIKPALSYLDIISKAKENFNIPIIAYNVSGEYSMLKTGIKNNIFEEDILKEVIISFKRAGANAIVSYFANEYIEKYILR